MKQRSTDTEPCKLKLYKHFNLVLLITEYKVNIHQTNPEVENQNTEPATIYL